MRKKIVAGNWKMNQSFKDGLELVEKATANIKVTAPKKLIFCTPFIHLKGTSDLTRFLENVHVGAQNCSQYESGAYTGETSAEMIRSTGTEFVIIGHSERRKYFGETEETLLAKTRTALNNRLKVIYCIGEVLEDREAGRHFDVVGNQLKDGVLQLDANQMEEIVLAYEPVWAIGTGKTATPQQAQEMHQFIRKMLTEQFDVEVADRTTILYGGSCKPGNAAELFANQDVDGGLIGGASLKAEDFLAIFNALN